jgi:hypothetical protein
MNEVLYKFGWIIKGIEFSIVLFWLHRFSKMKWKLFFGVKKDLGSVQHHELHSCFLSAFCFFIFHLIGSEAEQYLLSLQMEATAHIELFYTSMIIIKFSFVLTLFSLHLVRGCTFSPTARVCTYAMIGYMLFLFMELVARGYFGNHSLGMVYIVGGWVCNFVAISALAAYPLRSLKAYFKEKRTA